jgi:hypothetical protein
MPSAQDLAPAVALTAGAACVLIALALLVLRRGPLLVAPFVLAVGAALLALPWLAGGRPAAPSADATGPITVASVEVSGDGRSTVVAAAPATPPPPLPGRPATRIDIEAVEAEPNDTLAAANAAELGIAITGALGPGDLDFFAFDPPTGMRGEIVAALTVLEGNAGLTLYDDSGEPLGGGDTREQISVRTTTLARMLGAPRYYLLVRQSPEEVTHPARYHLTVAARRL